MTYIATGLQPDDNFHLGCLTFASYMYVCQARMASRRKRKLNPGEGPSETMDQVVVLYSGSISLSDFSEYWKYPGGQ